MPKKKTTSKKRTAHKKHKAHTRKNPVKKKIVRKRASHMPKQNQKNDVQFEWDLLPFAIAFAIALMVVVQSLNSTHFYQASTGTHTIEHSMHMAAEECKLAGAELRKLKSAERALQRSIRSLNEEETLVVWECAAKGDSGRCLDIKANLQKQNRLVQQKAKEVEAMRVKGCM